VIDMSLFHGCMASEMTKESALILTHQLTIREYWKEERIQENSFKS